MPVTPRNCASRRTALLGAATAKNVPRLPAVPLPLTSVVPYCHPRCPRPRAARVTLQENDNHKITTKCSPWRALACYTRTQPCIKDGESTSQVVGERSHLWTTQQGTSHPGMSPPPHPAQMLRVKPGGTFVPADAATALILPPQRLAVHEPPPALLQRG